LPQKKFLLELKFLNLERNKRIINKRKKGKAVFSRVGLYSLLSAHFRIQLAQPSSTRQPIPAFTSCHMGPTPQPLLTTLHSAPTDLRPGPAHQVGSSSTTRRASRGCGVLTGLRSDGGRSGNHATTRTDRICRTSASHPSSLTCRCVASRAWRSRRNLCA
jgi:hypothetical protein